MAIPNHAHWAEKLVVSVLLIMSAVTSTTSAAPLSPNWPVDYVIIYHDSLQSTGLQDFLDLKEAQGFSYRDVVIEDGASTASIKALIRHLYDSTEFVFPYVILVGTARQDSSFFDTLTNDALADATTMNYIPTPYLFDAYFDEDGIRRTGYDQWYSWLEPQHFVTRTPDVRIGRIPVRSAAELDDFVSKLTYYTNNVGDQTWKRHALLLSGDEYIGPSPEHQSPEAVNATINDLALNMPLSISRTILRNSDYALPADREQAFANSIDAGEGLILALATEANAGRLSRIIQRPGFDAASDLSNANMYPVAIGASCNIGQFDIDVATSEESLAENLLLAPSKGLIGIIGPSGFTSDVANYEFLDEVSAKLFDEGANRLGELAFATTATLKESQQGRSDTYDMMTVLGDPGMRVDLGSATDARAHFDASMEMSSVVPYQNRPYSLGSGVVRTSAGASKTPIRGHRSYCVMGVDSSAGDPTSYWTLFDNLGIEVGTESRFFTWLVEGISHCEGYEVFGVDCVLDDGTLLSACSDCGPFGIIDQYGTGLGIAHRHGEMTGAHFYAFDLANAFGKTIDKIVVGYGAASSESSGDFKAYFDDIRLSSEWGLPPIVGPIEMPANVYTNSVSSVSISIDDPDIQLEGDSLVVEWSVTDGSIVGSGPDVEYHAPSYEVWDVDIVARVTDLGGHVDSSVMNFGVFEHSGGGGCPHAFLVGRTSTIDCGAVMTNSKFDANGGFVTDILPIAIPAVDREDPLRLVLREVGKDVSQIDYISLSVADVSQGVGRLGLTTDGRVVRGKDPIEPFYCTDNNQNDQLARVRTHDARSFNAYGPGTLYVMYRGIAEDRLGKVGQAQAEGGGGGIDPPPKDQYKPAVVQSGPVPAPEVPNYISVSVQQGREWKEIARVPSRSYAGMPLFVDMLPYVNGDGFLFVKIDWTWSISIDDLRFFWFEYDSTQADKAISSVVHSRSGNVLQDVASRDDKRLIIRPGDEASLEFDVSDAKEYGLALLKLRGRYDPDSALQSEEITTGTNDSADPVLLQNQPNPFNSSTTVGIRTHTESHVKFVVSNILGQTVRVLLDERLEAGEHFVTWDGKDMDGQDVASGVYFYTVFAGGQSVSKKMVLLK